MLIKLTGGKVYDPANGVDGEVRDIFIENGRIVSPSPNAKVAHEYPLHGRVVMAGGIDPHSHIGGGKVTIARMLMPEDHIGHEVPRTELTRAGVGHAIPSTLTAGYRYAEMGYTAAFEPAMLPANARQAHMELADTPIIDKGAFVMLGSDDFFLRQLAGKSDFSAIKDYIAWTMHAAQAIAVKVVNPGGISAFKFNQRALDLDEKHTYYGVTPRDIIVTLARGVKELGVVHPIHIHGCNLGVPGGVETTLNTIKGSEGLPIHLTHIQFHSYGTEGDMKFSSGAARVAEAVNANKQVSIDVGQVMFGQTCTASGDSMRQFVNTRSADPKKWVVMDIECDAGCGVVPFKYRDKSFVNALQWAIGLELFLLVNDPWRIFLTTDHPNGGPFTCYPHLIRLLMDKTFRKEAMRTINQEALKYSTLGSLDREYTLYEIAIMTRAGPARSLGLKDRGHLGAGACADITVYDDNPDREAMFATPELLFKNGELIVRNGRIVKVVNGATHVARPSYDPGIEKSLKSYFDDYHTIRMENFRISDEEIDNGGRGSIIVQPTGARGMSMTINGIVVDDTFAEAFGMSGTGIIITADTLKWARIAATVATGFGTSVIGCGAECGIDKELSPDETPDGRPGVRILIFGFSPEALVPQVRNRIGQCVLTSPGSACYAGLKAPHSMGLGKGPRLFGDGFQTAKKIGGSRYWRVPVMDGEFVVEEETGVTTDAVGGGNMLIIGNDRAGLLETAEAAVDAIAKIDDVITPFPGGIVRSGSKVGAKYAGMFASTNDAFCPTLRGTVKKTELGPDSLAVLEIVIDGLTSKAVADAMRAGLKVVTDTGAKRGVTRVTAGNYGGKLGPHHYHLKDLV